MRLKIFQNKLVIILKRSETIQVKMRSKRVVFENSFLQQGIQVSDGLSKQVFSFIKFFFCKSSNTYETEFNNRLLCG